MADIARINHCSLLVSGINCLQFAQKCRIFRSNIVVLVPDRQQSRHTTRHRNFRSSGERSCYTLSTTARYVVNLLWLVVNYGSAERLNMHGWATQGRTAGLVSSGVQSSHSACSGASHPERAPGPPPYRRCARTHRNHVNRTGVLETAQQAQECVISSSCLTSWKD